MTLFIFAIVSHTAFAHPGGNKLVCKSANNSGSKQKLEVLLTRSNGLGWYEPTIKVNVDGKELQLTTPNAKKNYGTTFHNSPLKVITVTAEVPYADKSNTGSFTVVAMPESVKAFDNDNHPVKWSWKTEQDECSDANGRATFKGIIRGQLSNEDGTSTTIDPQIMDCELSYNSGMAC